MNVEEKLIEDLKNNEHVVQIIPYDDLVKEWQSLKPYANTVGSYTSSVKDSIVAAKLLREFGFQSNKVLMKTYTGKQYVIFKGYQGARKIFRGSKYLVDNPKVVRMAVGSKGIKSSVSGGDLF